jgi:UDP-N-acetylmuramoylalanine--D-glutamate ligase
LGEVRTGMLVKGKKAVVIGAGRTGIAVAKVLKGLGARVTVCDIKREYMLEEAIRQLKAIPVDVVAGGYPEITPENTDFLVISPGVPMNISPVLKAKEYGIPLWSEIELAASMFDAPIIAVTGTNGKTTTTSLLGRMFVDGGVPTVVAGNIGVPLIGEIDKITSDHVVVVEVSSFQLEAIHNFRPRVGIVLNVTPDHLDRHHTMEEYKQAKQAIFCNQGKGDFSVLNYDDELVKSMASGTSGEVIFFSLRHTLEKGAYLSGEDLYFSYNGKKTFICSRNDLYLKGDHNLENILASCCAALLMGLDPGSVAQTLRTFKGVKHRLQFVDEINGVKYVNDSKGTNPDASIKAISAYSEPIILIAGGKNKGSDFSEFAEVISRKVKEVIVLGEAAPEIMQALESVGYHKFSQVSSIEQAVARAARIAVPGDIVLLSPACASWDMFNNYEERGELYISQVTALRR